MKTPILAALIAPLLASLALADGTWLGTSYCAATPNATGLPAQMGIFGPDHAGSGLTYLDDPVLLVAGPVPAQTPGLFFFGPQATFQPFGDGFRCVWNPAYRLQPIMAGALGGPESLEQTFTFSDHPAMSPGTWYFQAMFRDPDSGFGFQTSDGVMLVIST